MQLKSLEIQGFKSFADKTQFVFDAGITGIVGPNGCGKSNIVDSMRWVLGEQKTRKLRSEKMENIIFNGTSKRKRSSFAQVSLTFENTKNILPTEYTTVSVTRKLYRSGDSEYLINGIPCRLKDIHNLFLDTGIGSDSYAIIELKMVDEILNDKENSRRQLFEEAAGISKYKVRKKQTLKRLKDTQDDLERVEDVLYEIQKQLKSLESQARKAKRYFDIKGKYKLVSSQYAWFAIRDLRGRYEQIEQEEKAFEDKLLAIQSQIAKFEARVQELRKEQIDNEQRLAESQRDLNAHNAKIQEIEKEKSIQNERLKYLQQREFAISDQLEKDRKQHLRITDELRTVHDQLTKVEKEFAKADSVLDGLRKAREAAKTAHEELRFQVEGYTEAYRELETELNRLQKEKEIKYIQIEGLRNEIKRNEADKTSKSDELDSFAGSLQALRKEVDQLDKAVAKLREKKEKNDRELEASSEEIDRLKDAIYKSNRGLDARLNEYQLTKSLVENLEGFPESVKYLKKEARWVRDAPLLSDIFYTQEAYKVAFENFLDPYLSYYVVDARMHAVQAVKLLSDAAKGRANFFILEELADYEAAKQPDIPGARPALEIVEVGEKYQQLAEYLLDQVYVVDDEAAIPENLPPSAMFITRSGNLMRRKYTLSGGSIGLFQGKRLGRAKNLEKLQKEIRKLEKELNLLKTKLDKQDALHQKLKAQTFGAELETQNRALEQKKRDLSVLSTREQEYKEFITRAGQRSEIIEQQIKDLEAELVTIQPRIEALKADFGEQALVLEEARRQLEGSTHELNEKSQAFNQQNIQYIQQKNHLEMLRRDAEQKSAQLRSLADSEQKNKAELAKTKQDIHDLVENNLRNDEDVIALYEEKKVKEARTGKLEQVAGQMRNHITENEDKTRAERKRKDDLEAERNDVKDRVTEIKIQLNSLKERMLVEFEVDISDLDEEELFEKGIEKYDAESVEADMLKLRHRLQNYGEINPMAVEAFDEMKERHDFINSQKQDLLDAKQTLLDTITEIDNTATEKFMESFSKIRENFKEVFQHLFYEGDTCNLELVDPSDPLDSRIEISAKPKGKRPLSINQLSGGEKTLTAVALLFSIYLLKPAPFCIFDEVDAPLDDANIDKFNNIIREFSKDSQFIIVTHNKRTMAATNVMYGVTMEKQGVSKVLPVDLVALNLE